MQLFEPLTVGALLGEIGYDGRRTDRRDAESCKPLAGQIASKSGGLRHHFITASPSSNGAPIKSM